MFGDIRSAKPSLLDDMTRLQSGQLLTKMWALFYARWMDEDRCCPSDVTKEQGIHE